MTRRFKLNGAAVKLVREGETSNCSRARNDYIAPMSRCATTRRVVASQSSRTSGVRPREDFALPSLSLASLASSTLSSPARPQRWMRTCDQPIDPTSGKQRRIFALLPSCAGPCPGRTTPAEGVRPVTYGYERNYVIRTGLKVIACVSETLQQREARSTMEVVAEQTKAIAGWYGLSFSLALDRRIFLFSALSLGSEVLSIAAFAFCRHGLLLSFVAICVLFFLYALSGGLCVNC